MAGNRSTQELRAVLEAKKASMKHHLAELESELTLRDVNVGGRPITDYVREQPLLAVGVAAGVGLVAGVIGGLLARDAPPEPDDRDLWMSAYLDRLVDDAGARVARGEDAEAALSEELRRRAPVVVLETERPKRKPSPTLNVLVNTALGFGAKFALDRMAQRLTDEAEVVEALEEAPAEASPVVEPRPVT